MKTLKYYSPSYNCLLQFHRVVHGFSITHVHQEICLYVTLILFLWWLQLHECSSILTPMHFRFAKGLVCMPYVLPSYDVLQWSDSLFFGHLELMSDLGPYALFPLIVFIHVFPLILLYCIAPFPHLTLSPPLCFQLSPISSSTSCLHYISSNTLQLTVIISQQSPIKLLFAFFHMSR
jgi:hypothetical protein